MAWVGITLPGPDSPSPCEADLSFLNSHGIYPSWEASPAGIVQAGSIPGLLRSLKHRGHSSGISREVGVWLKVPTLHPFQATSLAHKGSC